MGADSRTFLFTAFEPSGDAHAAPVIKALRERAPGARIVAWGGARMAAAGAEVISRTADDGTMGVPALDKILAVRRQVLEIGQWARTNPPTVHIPVDSPAANFPVCKRMKGLGCKVVHLVAPQLWAWGPWRIAKLRRLTDHVICLLPFEEAWFRKRGVAATFVGHPVLNEAHRVEPSPNWLTPADGSPKVLLLPGSRTIEVERNGAILVKVFDAVSRAHPGAVAVVAAANEGIAASFRRIVPTTPERCSIMTGVIDTAAAWCDFAIGVSGTVSLDLTRAHKPIIGIYRSSPLACMVAGVVLRSPYRLLPNILAGKALVPEFVPTSGSIEPIIGAALRIAGDANWRRAISAGLEGVTRQFTGHDPGPEAAQVILQVATAGHTGG